MFSQPIKADVLFVHGLLGAAFKTWRQKDCDVTEEEKAVIEDYTECWPKVTTAAWNDCVITYRHDISFNDLEACTF